MSGRGQRCAETKVLFINSFNTNHLCISFNQGQIGSGTGAGKWELLPKCRFRRTRKRAEPNQNEILGWKAPHDLDSNHVCIWLWMSYLNTLYFNFLIGKMGIIKATLYICGDAYTAVAVTWCTQICPPPYYLFNAKVFRASRAELWGDTCNINWSALWSVGFQGWNVM